jgi:hypothetical protein
MGSGSEDISNAIDQLGENLGSDLYVFLPDEQRYFLGEATLAALAGLLLKRFIEGIAKSKLGDALEAWGKTTGDWLAQRFSAIVKQTEGRDETPDRKEVVSDIESNLALVRSDSSLRAASSDIRDRLVTIMVERGLTRRSAERAASAVEDAVSQLLDVTD